MVVRRVPWMMPWQSGHVLVWVTGTVYHSVATGGTACYSGVMTKTSFVPSPGTLATYHAGSDRYAMIVVGTQRNGRTVLAQFLRTVTDELGENPTAEQLAEYMQRGLDAERRASFGRAFRRFTLRTDGLYRSEGSTRGFTLSFGKAVDYRDPSF